MKFFPSASKLIVALIGLQLMLPVAQSQEPVSATAAKIVPVQTPTNLSEDWALMIGKSLTPAPSSLKAYSEIVLKQLSEQQVFASWAHSQLDYFPLGPGTYSWLVTVSKDQNELGYLIFTATDNRTNEYILSEYGTSPSVPYQLTSLHQTLVQLDIISSSINKKNSITIEPLYSPLLPVWKISIDKQAPLYLNALTMEVLPWDESQWTTRSKHSTELSGAHFSTTDVSFTSSQAVSRKGQTDPLENLLWITTPRLSALTDQEFESYIENHNSLIFTSPNRNDEVGGPIAISGFQKWHLNQDTSQQTIYAGTGLTGHRYIPLTTLRDQGEFRLSPMTLN